MVAVLLVGARFRALDMWWEFPQNFPYSNAMATRAMGLPLFSTTTAQVMVDGLRL